MKKSEESKEVSQLCATAVTNIMRQKGYDAGDKKKNTMYCVELSIEEMINNIHEHSNAKEFNFFGRSEGRRSKTWFQMETGKKKFDFDELVNMQKSEDGTAKGDVPLDNTGDAIIDNVRHGKACGARIGFRLIQKKAKSYSSSYDEKTKAAALEIVIANTDGITRNRKK